MKFYYKLMILAFLFLPGTVQGREPVLFTDSSGAEIELLAPPKRVVSLVPSVTEMLLRLGVDKPLVGITYHSVLPSGAAGKERVGGFFRPDLVKVAALNPDVVFYADLQKDVPEVLQNKAVLIQLSARSIQESFEHIRLLGRIFDRKDQAEAIISEEQRQLDVIRQKTVSIPMAKRQRVMRLMGRQSVMTPGDDSFQNEYIRAAGGIPPQFGQDGNIIPVTLEQWQKFNPQLLYGCGGDKETLDILKQPGWKDVDAVKNKRVFFFPCALTCRAATHTGYFTSWLAAAIYGEEFGNPDHFVLPEQVVNRKQLVVDLPYISNAEIIESDIKDFRNKTVALHFDQPMKVVSTLEGQRDGITTVANHYFPPPSWGLGHNQGLAGLRESTLAILGFKADSTAILFTGANMDNLAVVNKVFKKMHVTALVTAGVQGNGVRMGADTGSFYEPEQVGRHKKPGTINILLLSNMRLSPRAMTRAIISATEGKTAALQDMDIRSSYSRPINQATGTGTDNIIVVEGRGTAIDSSGGHSKMGELMARAVYEGVQKAVHRQNGLVAKRSVFQRLKERRINLSTLSRAYINPKEKSGAGCSLSPDGKDAQNNLREVLEGLLQIPRYANFIKAMMAISDDYEKGLVTDLTSVNLWCQTIAEGEFSPVHTGLPKVMDLGFNALLFKASDKQQGE